MDHHRPLGRLPLRITLPGLLALLAVVWLPACTDGASALDITTTTGVPTSIGTTTTAAPPTTTTSTTTTSTVVTTSTTTTTIPRQPWQADGRAYYFPVQPPDVASYSGSHHDYPATDIFAPTGSIFVAVTDGVIA